MRISMRVLRGLALLLLGSAACAASARQAAAQGIPAAPAIPVSPEPGGSG
jgi:hypothetical protein